MALTHMNRPAQESDELLALEERMQTQVTSKANKVQEAWITPTLINGASVYSGSSIGYFKDEFGIVRLKGRIVLSADVVGFQLPLGYRPSETMSFALTTLNNSTFIRGQVDLTGSLKVFGTMYSFVDLCQIVFKGEA